MPKDEIQHVDDTYLQEKSALGSTILTSVGYAYWLKQDLLLEPALKAFPHIRWPNYLFNSVQYAFDFGANIVDEDNNRPMTERLARANIGALTGYSVGSLLGLGPTLAVDMIGNYADSFIALDKNSDSYYNRRKREFANDEAQQALFQDDFPDDIKLYNRAQGMAHFYRIPKALWDGTKEFGSFIFCVENQA